MSQTEAETEAEAEVEAEAETWGVIRASREDFLTGTGGLDGANDSRRSRDSSLRLSALSWLRVTRRGDAFSPQLSAPLRARTRVERVNVTTTPSASLASWSSPSAMKVKPLSRAVARGRVAA